MARPTIGQSPGQWPRNSFLDRSVADLAIAMLDEHAGALDALGGGGGLSTAVSATFSWNGAVLGLGGADSAVFAWPSNGIIVSGLVVMAGYSQGLPAGVLMVASVVSNDHVQVSFLNLSGSAQTLAAGTVRFVAY